MIKKATIASISLAIAGCASQPQDIQAQYVSPAIYNNYDCNQLTLEANRLSRRVSSLTGSLKKKADTDETQMTVGMLILWPTLFFLDGDGVEAQEYSRLKGEVEAVDQVFIQKNCSLASKPSTTSDTASSETPSSEK